MCECVSAVIPEWTPWDHTVRETSPPPPLSLSLTKEGEEKERKKLNTSHRKIKIMVMSVHSGSVTNGDVSLSRLMRRRPCWDG